MNRNALIIEEDYSAKIKKDSSLKFIPLFSPVCSAPMHYRRSPRHSPTLSTVYEEEIITINFSDKGMCFLSACSILFIYYDVLIQSRHRMKLIQMIMMMIVIISMISMIIMVINCFCINHCPIARVLAINCIWHARVFVGCMYSIIRNVMLISGIAVFKRVVFLSAPHIYPVMLYTNHNSYRHCKAFTT